MISVPAESIDGAPALELIGVSKAFGAVRALNDVSFRVRAGTVHALLGENGAGKTTLMRVAYGLVTPDAGVLRHFGQAFRGGDVRETRRRGIGMVQQQLSLVPALTATENVALGARGLFEPRRARDQLVALSQSSGLPVDPDAVVRDLSIVEQQRLEILKAISRGARLLILDEPTSGLAPHEVDALLTWITSFASSGGTVVLVTHKLREALAVSDHVTVLRRGHVAYDAASSGVEEREVARALFPDAGEASQPARPPSAGNTVVSASGVEIRDTRGVTRIRGAQFTIARGEIVGVAAIEGSGHRELLSALAGLTPASSGLLTRPERIALIPTNRTRDALIPEFTLIENVALRGAGERRGRMPWRALADLTTKLLSRFDVVATGPHARASTLSGGNQQRVVVARELADDADLVVADDPTRGLDIRASAFVHEQLRSAAARGAAVVVHSSDLDELLSLATRVMVVFHGTARDVPGERDAVGRAMIGATG